MFSDFKYLNHCSYNAPYNARNHLLIIHDAFSPVHEPDDVRLQETSDRNCSLFHTPSLRRVYCGIGTLDILGRKFREDDGAGRVRLLASNSESEDSSRARLKTMVTGGTSNL
ncbi:hypothetical protein BDZ89DRAFT_1055659 [Hymenopellis radicata]|nr:hypothetical protein BDZ89DRAFT_1055659 [Hymenopellis radicata]